MISVNLKAHLLSSDQDIWLVVSTQENDIPIAVTVDGPTKDMLMKMQNLYNEVPDKIINFFVKRYKEIVSFINKIKIPEDFVMPDNAKLPLFGISKKSEIIKEDLIEIEYINNLRLLHFFATPKMFRAFEYVAENYLKNPKAYYYVYTNFFEYFEKVIRK